MLQHRRLKGFRCYSDHLQLTQWSRVKSSRFFLSAQYKLFSKSYITASIFRGYFVISLPYDSRQRHGYFKFCSSLSYPHPPQIYQQLHYSIWFLFHILRSIVKYHNRSQFLHNNYVYLIFRVRNYHNLTLY